MQHLPDRGVARRGGINPASIGIAIVGGLLVSQALTLYTTAVIYLYLDRLLQWLAPRRHHASIGVAEHARASADSAVSEL